MLLGNKCDLKHKKNISDEQVQAFCKEKNIEWLEISAKEDINLREAFSKIVELILKDKTDDEIMNSFSVKIPKLSMVKEKKKKKKDVECC